MKISIVVAMSENKVIGDNGKLPWHIANDLKNFAKITKFAPVIMGRKTYESIGKPLTNRQNIIITKDKTFKAPGCQVVHNVASAIAASHNFEEVFVIGGAAIYKEFLPLCETIYLTVINIPVQGDIVFPEYDFSDWITTSSEVIDNDLSVDFCYSFVKMEYQPSVVEV